MAQPLRILITNGVMNGRTGTEIVTRDIALGLLRAGHQPTVYSPVLGEIARELAAAGVPVKAHAADLEGAFDIIHGHHLVACAAALMRYPHVPALSVCHDGESWFDAPVNLPNVVRYAAVSEVMVDRVALESKRPRDQISLVLNGCDMQRFRPGDPLPAKPRTALAFAKNTQHIEAIRAACTARGITIDFIGRGIGQVIAEPETALQRYDLVFASALSAIEALACLRPVIVCDGRGLAGMVDRARLAAWRPHNFGSAVLRETLTAEAILAEIDRYDPAEAAAAGALIREDAALPKWIAAYEAAYAQAIATMRPVSDAEASLAWARHLERWAPQSSDTWRFSVERQEVLTKLRRQLAGLELMPRARTVLFGSSGHSERVIALTGFDSGDAHSVWTSQRTASLRMHLGDVNESLEVEIDYSVYLPQPSFELDIGVLVNGAPVDAWVERGWSGWRRGKRTFAVSRADCQGIATWLTLRCAPRSPAEPGEAASLALHSIEVRDALD